MNLKIRAKNILERLGLHKNATTVKLFDYLSRYNRYAFSDTACSEYEQYEAVITRWYHTIEKGLSYRDFRPGFGQDKIAKLLGVMEAYAKSYDTGAFFYRTALSCLDRYVKKNKEYGFTDEALYDRIGKLPGTKNDAGGTVLVKRPDPEELRQMNFEQLLYARRSIREFSDEPVDTELLQKAVGLAGRTPSACNRQGWKTRIISDRKTVAEVLQFQNGNRGFGEMIDKLLLVTCDIRYFNRNRELFQPFIDGGMYAQNLLNALFYEGIGSIPLSASLTNAQDKSVRRIAGIGDQEVLILFIGVGNYPKECLTARSERREG